MLLDGAIFGSDATFLVGRAVLVGDTQQLPAIVLSQSASKIIASNVITIIIILNSDGGGCGDSDVTAPLLLGGAVLRADANFPVGRAVLVGDSQQPLAIVLSQRASKVIASNIITIVIIRSDGGSCVGNTDVLMTANLLLAGSVPM